MPKVRCLLVSHNAGGAALLAAWAAHHARDYIFHCLLSGPAVTVFCQRLSTASIVAQHSVALRQYDCVITSTSSAETGWETLWIERARQQAIKTISLLDHWTNYLSRFLWRNNYIFPDELWVCDPYALKIAQDCKNEQENYPGAQQIPNFYLMDQIAYIKNKRGAVVDSGHILYVSEPSNNLLYTAQSALEEFLQFLTANEFTSSELRLRLHPRENLDDYQPLIECWQDKLAVTISPNSRLEDDLCWAFWVVGCQTMAMVVAQAAGIKVASCLPACVVNSALPHREIPRLFNLKTSVGPPKAV